ncbi:phosphotransferase enzyme family protein [Paenibacillus sp. 481]|uniref:phosphotransferase enzyme family protein n=1 Tax=Paenibacillus sp. 481 TaxID=2835869 RepID=UPI001E51753C|nr:phosphotransferase [Paenibacillus sp. 481]UHA74243.1 phosphotransferase [Paenibacillus sp. 481]
MSQLPNGNLTLKMEAVVAQQYNIVTGDLQLLGGYYKQVYETSDACFVVKGYNEERDNRQQVESEMDWVAYLHDHDCCVASPLRSASGQWTASLDAETFITVSTKWNGTAIDSTEQAIWNDQLFKKWGKTMGSLHRLAGSYQAKQPASIRDWSEEPVIGLAGSNDHGSNKVAGKWAEAVAELQAWPKDRSQFGLIHHDMHHGNILVDGEQLAVLDFGDLIYHWFAYDVAIAVHAAAVTVDASPFGARTQFARRFLGAFLEGYEQEHPFSAEQRAQLPFLLWYRQLYSYMYHTTHRSMDGWSEQERHLLHVMKERIEQGVRAVEL